MTTLPRQDRGTDDSAAIQRLGRLHPRWRWQRIRSRVSAARRLITSALPRAEAINLDEYRDNTAQLIRADLPGLDPTHDIEVVVAEDMLRIEAFRAVPEAPAGAAVVWREPHYGRLTRTLPLAKGAGRAAITAIYEAGVLSVRVPLGDTPTTVEPTVITIARS